MNIAANESLTCNPDAPEAWRTASSFSSKFRPGLGRLASTSSWVPAENTPNQWYQIDLGRAHRIDGLVTMGSAVSDSWVTNYIVSISEGEVWKKVSGGDQFLGNRDRNSAVVRRFKNMLKARYIRIAPTGWHKEIALRAGVLCSSGDHPVVYCYYSQRWLCIVSLTMVGRCCGSFSVCCG